MGGNATLTERPVFNIIYIMRTVIYGTGGPSDALFNATEWLLGLREAFAVEIPSSIQLAPIDEQIIGREIDEGPLEVQHRALWQWRSVAAARLVVDPSLRVQRVR